MLVKEVSSEKLMNTIIAANSLLNQYTNHDPFHLAWQLGIRIIHWQLNDNVKAFITRDAYGATIFINKEYDNLSRKILCAHELGHYFNGDVDSMPAFFDKNIDPEKEYLANVFMTILYPQAEMRLKADGSSDIKEINSYFDSLLCFRTKAVAPKGEILVFNNSKTIFDEYTILPQIK